MRQNMGTADRVLRYVLAGAAVVLAILVTTGWWDVYLLGLALGLTATSLIGVCPLYIPFHISTKKNNPPKD